MKKVKLTQDHYHQGVYRYAGAVVELPDEAKLGEGMVLVEEPAKVTAATEAPPAKKAKG